MTEDKRSHILDDAVRQYKELRRFIESEKEFLDLINKGEEKTWTSKISKFFFHVAVSFGKSGFKRVERGESNTEYRKKATEVLTDPSFKRHLCRQVQSADRVAHITDEGLVTLVCATLMDSSGERETQIDPRLIANVAVELQAIGVNVYCGVPSSISM